MKETIVIGGVDRQNQLCIICRPKFHLPGNFSIEELVSYGLFILETAIKKIEKENLAPKITVVYDRREMTSANRDSSIINFTYQFVGLLQDYYAERLAKMYVIGANWVYRGMYYAIRPFLAEKTQEKIVLV
jgi:hypothetical protein